MNLWNPNLPIDELALPSGQLLRRLRSDEYRTVGRLDRCPVEQLEALGYAHTGDQGVPAREAFKPGRPDGFMAYHMYVCPQDSPELRRHLAFRDWLRGHDGDRDAYAALKRRNAALYPHDIDAYIAGKGDFIQDIINKAMKENIP